MKIKKFDDFVNENLSGETEWRRERIDHLDYPEEDIDSSEKVRAKYFTYDDTHYAIYVDNHGKIILHGDAVEGGNVAGHVYRTYTGGIEKAKQIFRDIVN